MKKLFCGFVWLMLLAAPAAEAQKAQPKKGKTAARPVPPKAVEKEDIPPVEQLEATRIDVEKAPPPPPPAVELDTTAAPEDALTAEIRKMLAITNSVEVGLGAAQQLLTQQRAANTDTTLNEFYALFQQEVQSSRVYRLFENIFIKVYRTHFTLEEIRQLNEFYKTPLGKKTVTATPLILQTSQQEGGKLGQMLAMEIVQRLSKQ